MVNEQQSSQDKPGSASRPLRSERYGIVRAVLTWIGVTLLVWTSYYLVGDLRTGNVQAGVVMGGLFTTMHQLIFVGLPTLLCTTILLLLRRVVLAGRLVPLAVVAAFGPIVFWLSVPRVIRETMLIQLIAQAVFFGYLLLRLRGGSLPGIFRDRHL